MLTEDHVRGQTNQQRVPDLLSGKTPLAYATAAARREIAWISKFAKPDKERSSFSPPTFEPSAHVALLERYLGIMPSLMPSDPCVTRLALVYDDSGLANLFISEEKLAEGKIEISAVIDWSRTAIRPLFIAAQWPKFAKHPEPQNRGASRIGPRIRPHGTFTRRFAMTSCLTHKLTRSCRSCMNTMERPVRRETRSTTKRCRSGIESLSK